MILSIRTHSLLHTNKQLFDLRVLVVVYNLKWLEITESSLNSKVLTVACESLYNSINAHLEGQA